MDGTGIHFKLDLVVWLMDTTTGEAVPEGERASFLRDGKELPAYEKGGGRHIFINLGREDFLMQVRVRGYEDASVAVAYAELDTNQPTIDVFLIPSENTMRGGAVLSLTGRKEGLSAIQAVSLSRPIGSVSQFDERKKVMTLFLPNRSISMEAVHYGLVHEADATYEPFVVTDANDAVSVKLKEPLGEPFTINSPVSRIVFGRVDDEGNYVLRVRDTGRDLRYLVRFIVDGEARFKEVDFHDLEGFSLDDP